MPSAAGGEAQFYKEAMLFKVKRSWSCQPSPSGTALPSQCLSASLQPRQGRRNLQWPVRGWALFKCLDSDPGAIKATDNSSMDYSKSSAGSEIAWVWDVWEVEWLGKDLQKPQLFLHLWANALIYAQLHWQLVWLQLHLTSYIIKTSKNPPICLFRTCLRLGSCSCGQERGCAWRWTWGIVPVLPKSPIGLFPVVSLVSRILVSSSNLSFLAPAHLLTVLPVPCSTNKVPNTNISSNPMCMQQSLGFSLSKFQVPWKKKKREKNEKDEVWRY